MSKFDRTEYWNRIFAAIADVIDVGHQIANFSGQYPHDDETISCVKAMDQNRLFVDDMGVEAYDQTVSILRSAFLEGYCLGMAEAYRQESLDAANYRHSKMEKLPPLFLKAEMWEPLQGKE